MPFGWDDASNAYDQAQNVDQPHEGSFGHELIAGAASFAAMKAFESHQRAEGKEVSHGFAKELIAGFAGAEVDKLAETKGADWIDREKAKRQASEQAKDLYDQHYGSQGDQWNPDMQAPNY